MDISDMAATAILHFPTRKPRTRTVSGVVSAEIEWGSENVVTLEKVGGGTETFEGIGLTISAFTLDGDLE